MSSQSEFTVVSLFAGCGGSSLGYHWAGGKVLLAVEWDNNAAATYQLNFPDTPIYHGDICKLSVEECLKLTGLNPGELDMLDGSPPCQGFSTAGKRNMNDSRNQLFREYVRLLRGLQPKVFVMENVSGMVKGKMKLIFVEILRELKASGYKVKARLMNAKWYGVPQSRERMIFIGVREDLGIEPSYPKPQGRAITVREALGLKSGYIKNAMFQNRAANMGWRSIDCPSPTLRKTFPPEILIPGEDIRFLTLDESKKLASFPAEYTFTGKESIAYSRIGNAVMPRFMQAIAEHIKMNILEATGETFSQVAQARGIEVV